MVINIINPYINAYQEALRNNDLEKASEFQEKAKTYASEVLNSYYEKANLKQEEINDLEESTAMKTKTKSQLIRESVILSRELRIMVNEMVLLKREIKKL